MSDMAISGDVGIVSRDADQVMTAATKPVRGKQTMSRRLSSASHVPLHNPAVVLNNDQLKEINELILKFPDPPNDIHVEPASPVWSDEIYIWK